MLARADVRGIIPRAMVRRAALPDGMGETDGDSEEPLPPVPSTVRRRRTKGVGRAVKRPQSTTEIRKQLSLFVTLAEYQLVREHAARQGKPMTDVVREWISPHLAQLRRAA